MSGAETVHVTFGQTDFWQDRNGLIHLIDEMDESYRINVASFLVKHAAVYHLRKRRAELARDWWFQGGGDYNGDHPPEEQDDEYPDVRAIVRKEQDRGEHLDWLRSTPLFVRLSAGLVDRLPAGVSR